MAEKTIAQQFNDSVYIHLYNFDKLKGELDSGTSKNQLKEKYFIKDLVSDTNVQELKLYKFNNLFHSSPEVGFW